METERKYITSWTRSREKGSFGEELDDSVRTLCSEMKNALRESFRAKSDTKDSVLRDMKAFLGGYSAVGEKKDGDKKASNKKGNGIDSCIRWLVLRFAADEIGYQSSVKNLEQPNESTPKDPWLSIIEIIVDIEPYLAFEPLTANEDTWPESRGNLQLSIRKECRDGDHQHLKDETTPFKQAVTKNNYYAVKHMVDGLSKYCTQLVNEDGDGYTKTLSISRRRPLFAPPTGADDHKALMTHVLQQKEDDDERRALERVAIGRHSAFKTRTMKELLKQCPEIALAPDRTFDDALKAGRHFIVEELLKVKALRDQFVTSKNIIDAMDAVSKKMASKDIVQTLLGYADTDEVFDHRVVQKIIELDLLGSWKNRSPKVKPDTKRLLHMAVYYQRLDFVELFIADYPVTVTEKDSVPGTEDTKSAVYYPLWYNNKTWEISKWVDRVQTHQSSAIRSQLVVATVRGARKMQELSEILEQSAERVQELCFDWSKLKFNSKVYRMHQFVQSVINHRENERLLKYEPTIKYARFPALDLHPDDKGTFGQAIPDSHTEVFDILDWLNDKKKVTSILELKVPDRLVNPHNELDIAHYVRLLKVESLDWRFLDLSLSIFHTEVKSRIREIHLYSSGKLAPISHWFSSQGLISFPNLTFVRVHVIEEMVTGVYRNKIVKILRGELSSFKTVLQAQKKAKAKSDEAVTELDEDVLTQPWNPTHERVANLEETAQRAFPKLSRFILSYRDFATDYILPPEKKPLFRPTRIAIIDNGILSVSPVSRSNLLSRTRRDKRIKREQPGQQNGGAAETDDEANLKEQEEEAKSARTLWSRIKEGRSFVEDDVQLSPWLFASDPHGTQMANLICSVDPVCELYVAKVTDGNKYGISPRRVARAINWARRKDVDIISMSFSILDSSDELATAIEDAKIAGIVMMCSSHDEGTKVAHSWPADSADTFTVAACDDYGKLSRELTEDKYQFSISGMNVAAGVVPFLESEDRISGSSVATAIASGLSSLILSCARLHSVVKGKALPDDKKRRNVVNYYLKKMQATPSKHVLLERFGGIDAAAKGGESIMVGTIIERDFDTVKAQDEHIVRM